MSKIIYCMKTIHFLLLLESPPHAMTKVIMMILTTLMTLMRIYRQNERLHVSVRKIPEVPTVVLMMKVIVMLIYRQDERPQVPSRRDSSQLWGSVRQEREGGLLSPLYLVSAQGRFGPAGVSFPFVVWVNRNCLNLFML